MRLRNGSGMENNLMVWHYDADGNLKDYKEYHNLIVDDGLALSSQLLGEGLGGDRISHIAVGTDSTPPSSGQSALLSEEMRDEASVSLEETNVAGDTARFANTFNFASATNVRELGLFNAASNGVMFARKDVVHDMEAGENLQVQWDVVSSEKEEE